MTLVSVFLFFILSAKAQINGNFGGAGGGAVRIGGSATACSSSTQGALKYVSGAGDLYYCDGSNWTMAVTDPCGSSLPNNWDFTDLTGQSLLTKVNSSIHQVTNIAGCTTSVKVSANTGTPEYRICDDASCSTVSQDWSSLQRTITNNKYIQLRTTTSSAASTTITVAIVIGSRVESWNVTTLSNCAAAEPTVGSMCADGSVYIGRGPDGGTKMYTTACLAGSTWNGSQCEGTRYLFPWAKTETINTGNTSYSNGETITANLAGLSNADAPYPAAVYCHNLIQHGQSDWYLPAYAEASLLQASCGLIPDAACAASRHWTSSENNATQAYYYTLNGGYTADNKTTNYNLRCVRKD